MSQAAREAPLMPLQPPSNPPFLDPQAPMLEDHADGHLNEEEQKEAEAELEAEVPHVHSPPLPPRSQPRRTRLLHPLSHYRLHAY